MPVEQKYKTFWPRLGAAFLDGAALAPLIWLDKILWNTTSIPIILFLWLLIYTAISLSFSIGFLYYFGQTPGKMATGVIVLDHHGKKLSFQQAILRNIVSVVITPLSLFIVSKNLFIGEIANRGYGEDMQFLWWNMGLMMIWMFLEMITMLFNSKRRAIHDLIAGTVVVRQPIEERIGNYKKIRWILIILLILSYIIPNLIPENNMKLPRSESNIESSDDVSKDSKLYKEIDQPLLGLDHNSND